MLGCDGSGTNSGVIAGMDWVTANHVKPAVANMSLGGGASTATDDAVQRMYAAGVTVVVQSPALQGEQAEITDNNGRYIITQLPSGDDYKVSFFFGADDKPRVERPGIRLSLGKTVTVNGEINLSSTKREVKVIRESAPVLRATPVRGRTFESILTLAPGTSDVAGKTGAAGGDVGVQISGSTGSENNYIIDGLNTSDPNKGLIGTELSQYFIQEINVITGGYQAEYGRATGGVVNIATKTGGNEFKGSVFGSFQPFQLEPRGVARLGEALITRSRTNLLYDFGFELGGPIVKDRIWFYVGFAPTFTERLYQRQARSLSFDAANGRAALDNDFQCPAYLANSSLCDGPRTLALRTEVINYAQDAGAVERSGSSRKIKSTTASSTTSASCSTASYSSMCCTAITTRAHGRLPSSRTFPASRGRRHRPIHLHSRTSRMSVRVVVRCRWTRWVARCCSIRAR